MIPELKLLTDLKEVKKVYDFIEQFPLDYPNYENWLKKCKRQLEMGSKKVFYATNKSSIIGSLIFQKHIDESSVLEVKNFRVSEEHSCNGIGSALEIMLCLYGKSNGFKRIRVDTHNDNFPMIKFLIKRNYLIEGKEKLYTPNTSEIILYKDL